MVDRLLRVAILIGILWSLVPPFAASAQAQATGRPRIIFDNPTTRSKVIVSGQTLDLVVPFHTTGDIRNPLLTVWSRGVTVTLLNSNVGDLAAFTSASVTIRVTAPARILSGLYSIRMQVRDPDRKVREMFRTSVVVIPN